MIVDLFAGPGGWDVAAKRLGLDPIGFEWDDAACQTREAAGLRTVQCDVARVDLTQIGHVEGLIASPPCQGFSMAGKGKGRQDADKIITCAHELAMGHDTRDLYDWVDPRSALVLEPIRWVAHFRPTWVALEQVPAVLPLWSQFAQIMTTMWGYHVDVGVLQAEQHGVPQTRKRAILVAHLDHPVRLPKPTHSKYYPRDPEKLDDGVLPWHSMAEALGWGMTARPSMTVTAGGGKSGGAEPFGNGARKGMLREAVQERWVHMAAGVTRAGRPRDLEHPAGTVTGKGTGYWVDPAAQPPEWPYHRPATTVNCDPRIAAPGRHDPAQSGSQYGPGTTRVTVQEAAVLQSFPADHPWQGSRTKQFEQVGNAIPPLLAEAILKEVLS